MITLGPNAVRAYTPAELTGALSSESWQSMGPNYPNTSDLLPTSLNTYLIEEVAEAALQLTADGLHAPFRTEEQEAYLAPSYPVRGGSLEPIGTGDSKSCYRLRTSLGTLAVQVLSQDQNLGLHVPLSRFLTAVRESPVLKLWEYADTRSYLVLPYSGSIGVRFQEDGGEHYATAPLPHSELAKYLTRRRAIRRIIGELEIDERDWQFFNGEAAHARHYLKKQGHALPLMIDVPLEERGFHSTD